MRTSYRHHRCRAAKEYFMMPPTRLHYFHSLLALAIRRRQLLASSSCHRAFRPKSDEVILRLSLHAFMMLRLITDIYIIYNV